MVGSAHNGRKPWKVASKLISATILATLCAFTAFAGPFEDVVTAYENDKFQEAYQILLPLANTYAKPETAKAQYLLGNQYLGGFGVEKSEATAWKWHKKAVAGFMLTKDYAAIEKMLQPYMNNNIVSGKIAYANLLISAGNADDSKKGHDYIKQMAEAGNAIALFEMAAIDPGSSTDRFERMARKIVWYKLSADQGYAPAQIAYGNFLGKGNIASSQKIHAANTITDMPTEDKEKHKAWKNKQKLKWLKKAAAQNDADGLCALGYFYKGQYSDASQKQAYTAFKGAAAQGHLQAQYELAWAYAGGYGVAQDKEKAKTLYQDIIDRMGIIPMGISAPMQDLRRRAKRRLKELTQEEGK